MVQAHSTSVSSLHEQWQARIRAAAAKGQPLALVGAGSKAFYGHRTAGEPLVLAENQGVVDYEPSELVLTVRGGTTLADIEALLAEQRQFLAFEPALYGGRATIAGAVATGLAGPRRAQAGGLRDFILGVQLIDGQGRLLNFGGQVMKNVAGYDVSRLLAGSLGTLGVITQLSLKVLPLPVAERSQRLELSQAQALKLLNQWGGQPLPISASAWVDGRLYVRLSGAPSALEAAQSFIGGETMPVEQGQRFWRRLREQEHDWFYPAAYPGHTLWRLSLPSTVEPILKGQPQLIEWGGALRWCWSAQPAADIRAAVAEFGGTATAFRPAYDDIPIFHPLEPVVLRLQQRLKQKFDPAGIFNPGKIYPGAL